MTNIDLFGSRYTLIPLMRNSEELKFELNKVYLGSALTSQYAKTQRLDTKHIQKKMNKYETLEVMNDRLKLFRRFSKQTKSKIIVIDFLNEGYEIINSNSGRTTLTVSNMKFDKKIKENQLLTSETRINLINNNIESFSEDLKKYDKVLLNRLRLSKYLQRPDGSLKLKENIEKLNLMNSIIESFEDLLIEKINDISIIPLYDKHYVDSYWFTQEYLQHVKEHIMIKP